MRKAGLLEKKPLKATRKMLETARNDKGTQKRAARWNGIDGYTEYGSRYYFRAVESADRGILEVDLFTRKDLASGRTDPRFRIFLDRARQDFASWDMVNGKWSSAKIDLLETDDDRYSYSYRGRNHATRETLNTVNGYLHTGCMNDVETAVLDFQTRIRGTEISHKHKLATDAIDSYMAMVPDRLPADWMKFINDRVLEHSVFYLKDAKAGYCTHCRLHVPVPGGVRHLASGKCSRCGSSVTYRSWKKQQRTEFRTTAAILQKCTDGAHYVYRQFRVAAYAERKRYYEPEIRIHEDWRSLFIPDIAHGMTKSAKNYEWGQFRYTGIERWCEDGTVNHGGYGQYAPVNHGYSRSVLYTGNMKKLLKGTEFQYIPAAEIVRGMGSERINVLAMLDDMKNGFPYEAFWKMGMRRFVQDRVRVCDGKGLTMVSRTEEGSKPWELLGMSREDLRQAARIDATDRQTRIIQKAAGMGVRLEDGQVTWFDRIMGVHHILDYIGIQTPHRIIRYLCENAGAEECGTGKENESLHFWTDYLDTARKMGWDLHDRSVFFPQDIKRAHDEAAVAFMVMKDKEDAEKMREKDGMMRRNAAEIKKVFSYSDDTYVIKVPECYLDFKHEGHAQHNCVATYYDRALEGKLIILFVRKRQEPDRPFCTVEVRNRDGRFDVRQNRAAYNRQAPEDAAAFMEKAVREAQRRADRMQAEGTETHGSMAG